MDHDPWRTDASTSVSDQLDRVDLDGDVHPSQIEDGSDQTSHSEQASSAQPSTSDVQLDSVTLDQHSPVEPAVDPSGKGKGKMSQADATQQEAASPVHVSRATSEAADRPSSGEASAQAAANGAIGAVVADSAAPAHEAMPRSMPTIPKNFKPPSQKKIDKSLKKSRAAPPVLDQVLSKTRQKYVKLLP